MAKRQTLRNSKTSSENIPLELYCLALANESARKQMAEAGARLVQLGRKLQIMARARASHSTVSAPARRSHADSAADHVSWDG